MAAGDRLAGAGQGAGTGATAGAAFGPWGALIGGVAGAGLGALGAGGANTGQAGKLAERQANLSKKVLNTAQFQLENQRAAARRAIDQASQFPSTVVPFAPETQQALDFLRQQAFKPTGSGALRTLGIETAQGRFLDPATNPFLAGTIEAATRPTIERLTEAALPGIQSAAISAGAFGGNRPELVAQGVTRDATREALDISNRIAFENLMQERNRQMQAGNVLTQASALGALPAQLLTGIGATRESQQAQRLAEERERFELRNQGKAARPLAGLDAVMRLAAGAPSVPITNASPGASQVASEILRGALGGGLIGGALSPTLARAFQSVPQVQPQPLPNQFATSTTGVGGAGFSLPFFGGPR